MIGAAFIDPDCYYDREDISDRLGVSIENQDVGRRSGELRHIEIGDWVIYKGSWINAWLEFISKPKSKE